MVSTEWKKRSNMFEEKAFTSIDCKQSISRGCIVPTIANSCNTWNSNQKHRLKIKLIHEKNFRRKQLSSLSVADKRKLNEKQKDVFYNLLDFRILRLKARLD